MDDRIEMDNYESDIQTDSDLDLEEQREMEIALYSKLHYDAPDSVIENDDDEKNNYNIDVTYQNDKIDQMSKLKSSESNHTQCLTTKESLRTENKAEMSKRTSVRDDTKDVIKISDEESVISIDSETLSFLDFDELGADSDIMILDEYISDMDDIKVHVDDNQKTMLKKLTHKQTEEEMKDSEKWAILDQDRYSGSDLKKRYYKSISVRCNNCRDTGHLSRDCPKPQKHKICFLCGYTGHNNKNCPNGICYNCEQIGHMSFDCKNPRINPHIECHRCSMFGHHQKDCPDIWRQYHMTTIPGTLQQTKIKENSKMFCCNCASRRHFGYNCPMGRGDKHSYPSYPFIGVYRQYRNWEKDRPLKRKRDYEEEEVENHINKKAKHEDYSRNKKYTSFATRIKEKIQSKFANKSGKESESEQPSTSKGNSNKRKNKNKNLRKSSDNVSSTGVSDNRTVLINKGKNNRASMTLHRETDNEEFKHQAFNNQYWEKNQGKKKKNKKKKNKKGNNNEQYTQGQSDRNANSRIVHKTNRGFQISLNTQKTQLMFKR